MYAKAYTRDTLELWQSTLSRMEKQAREAYKKLLKLAPHMKSVEKRLRMLES